MCLFCSLQHYIFWKEIQMPPGSKQLLKMEDVVHVELFVRDSPRCPFCDEAKKWIQENLPHSYVRNYSIMKDSQAWWNFIQRHQEARSVPQMELTMRDGSIAYIGSTEELLRSFEDKVPEPT
jgi:glutaredoxin